jgi:hypothetical protein
MTNKKNEDVTPKDDIKPQPKNIQDMSVIEIKSILYDQIVLSEVTKQNIDMLQTELKARSESPEKQSE